MPNPTPEGSLLRSCKTLLELLRGQGLLTYTRINVQPVLRGPKKIRTPNRDMEGFSDLEIVANGKVGYVELKAGKGKLSAAQKSFLSERERHGASVCVVYTPEQLIEFLKSDMGVSVKLTL